MAKIDPHKTEEKYLKWKEQTKSHIPGISPTNASTLRQYLFDMEHGFNVSSANKKGARSFLRLNVLRMRIPFIMTKLEELYNLNDILKVSEQQICKLFADMRTGEIAKSDGGIYKSTKDFAKDFKSFWHWHQKVSKKKGIEIQDITTDFDTSGEKPKWVYLTEEEVRMLADNAKYEYKTIILFLFDSGIRAPTELMNLKVSDFFNDFKEVQITDEISKTFGRRIKLMISSNLLKKYVKDKKLQENDYLFTLNPYSVNRYLKNLAKRFFQDRISPAGEKYCNLTMYDFRHCSCCYWLVRYKSESALKYRFGWKKSEKIHYYSEMIGMRDTICEDDLLMDMTRTEIEKKLQLSENQNKIMQEEIKLVNLKINRLIEFVQENMIKQKSGGVQELQILQ